MLCIHYLIQRQKSHQQILLIFLSSLKKESNCNTAFNTGITLSLYPLTIRNQMNLELEEELVEKEKKTSMGPSSNLSSRNVGHSLLQRTAGIWLWCVYDVRVERERRSDTGTVTTLITELRSCAESHRFSFTPITWISCMAIMNHRRDHGPLMGNHWQVGPGCFLILLFLCSAVWGNGPKTISAFS